MTNEEFKEVGKLIYSVIEGRKGFRQDQLGIDDEVWDDIMCDLGHEAWLVVACYQPSNKPALTDREG